MEDEVLMQVIHSLQKLEGEALDLFHGKMPTLVSVLLEVLGQVLGAELKDAVDGSLGVVHLNDHIKKLNKLFASSELLEDVYLSQS